MQLLMQPSWVVYAISLRFRSYKHQVCGRLRHSVTSGLAPIHVDRFIALLDDYKFCFSSFKIHTYLPNVV